MDVLSEYATDATAFLVSAAIVCLYYFYLNFRVRNDPTYSVHGVHQLARRLWVENIMRNSNKDVMAVQTLRNFIMGASLMASTAALLIIGTLTLSGQAKNNSISWHAHGTVLWDFKVILLLLAFIVGFFAFAMAVRLANHVVFMINVPEHDAHHMLSPRAVARRLHRAGRMFSIGMRTFFIAIPLVFWLFGPYFLLSASIGLVIALYQLDRSEAEEDADASRPAALPAAGVGSPVVSMHVVHAK